MPYETARETGFGTGLLAHLEQRDPEAAPPPPPPEPDPEPDPRVEAEVHQRELAVREAALGDALRRVAELEAALARQAEPEGPRRPAGAVLRERAEREGDRLWRAFDEALDATFPDGRPDVRTRLEAAETLLAQLELADAVTPPDELAFRRDLRLGRVLG